MTAAKEGIIGWRVSIHGDGDRVEYEQEFFLRDFKDARERACQNCERIKRVTYPEPIYREFVQAIWGILDHPYGWLGPDVGD